MVIINYWTAENNILLRYIPKGLRVYKGYLSIAKFVILVDFSRVIRSKN